jgi:hypothetical protein
VISELTKLDVLGYICSNMFECELIGEMELLCAKSMSTRF